MVTERPVPGRNFGCPASRLGSHAGVYVPRCKINFITRTICMFNDERDGIARAVIELKNVLVRAIDDDEGHPYVFVLHASKNADKVRNAPCFGADSSFCPNLRWSLR